MAIERGEAQKDSGISGLWRSGSARYRCDLSPKRCGVISCAGNRDEHREKIWNTDLSSNCRFELISKYGSSRMQPQFEGSSRHRHAAAEQIGCRVAQPKPTMLFIEVALLEPDALASVAPRIRRREE